MCYEGRGRGFFFQTEKICSYGGVFLGALCWYFENRSWLGFIFPYVVWIAFLPSTLKE